MLVSGGVFWGLSRKELSRLRTNDLPTDADAKRSADRGKVYQTLGYALLGAGVIASGAMTYNVLREPGAPVALGLGPVSVSVFGSWP